MIVTFNAPLAAFLQLPSLILSLSLSLFPSLAFVHLHVYFSAAGNSLEAREREKERWETLGKARFVVSFLSMLLNCMCWTPFSEQRIVADVVQCRSCHLEATLQQSITYLSAGTFTLPKNPVAQNLIMRSSSDLFFLLFFFSRLIFKRRYIYDIIRIHETI